MIKALIVAIAKNNVIGNNGKLPWKIKEDLRLFKQTTLDSVVIMGRKTFESIGRPLPKRINIVLSSTMQSRDDVIVVKSINKAFQIAQTYKKNIFVIGGSKVYEESIPFVNAIYISHIKEKYKGDTYFPKIDWSEWQVYEEKIFEEFIFTKYKRFEELQ